MRFASSRRRSARRSSTRKGPVARAARFSLDRAYRYTLRRSWNRRLPACAFVLLNPSTADERDDDPTVRRCVAFAAASGFGAAILVNLFALRATDPRGLLAARDPIGTRNDAAIRSAARCADAIVLSWGRSGAAHASRAEAVLELLAPYRRRLYVLGLTRSGEPRHPLYLRAGTRLRRASWVSTARHRRSSR